MKEKYATVIGSRNITKEEYIVLRDVATKLAYEGYTLRSGGAEGADSTINHLCKVEIIIPWNGFNHFQHNGKRIFTLGLLPHVSLAEAKAKSIHPAPERLTQGALKLHTRNIYQIIGPYGNDGYKSDIVVFCADADENGIPVGGTRTGVVYAQQLDIPTFNIRNHGFDVDALLQAILGRIQSNKESQFNREYASE